MHLQRIVSLGSDCMLSLALSARAVRDFTATQLPEVSLVRCNASLSSSSVVLVETENAAYLCKLLEKSVRLSLITHYVVASLLTAHPAVLHS